MKNFEEFIDEIANDLYVLSKMHFEKKEPHLTHNFIVFDPKVHDVESIKEWLLKEYKPTIKLSKFEFDLIATNDQSHNRPFDSFQTYKNMMKRGHFKNIKDTSMTLNEIIKYSLIEE